MTSRTNINQQLINARDALDEFIAGSCLHVRSGRKPMPVAAYDVYCMFDCELAEVTADTGLVVKNTGRFGNFISGSCTAWMDAVPDTVVENDGGDWYLMREEDAGKLQSLRGEFDRLSDEAELLDA